MQRFAWFAYRIQRLAGSPQMFVIAVGGVLVWLFSGPIFHWSNGWELIINTVTTLVTFLLGFVVQGSLNRQSDEDRRQWDRIEARLGQIGSGRVVLVRLARLERQAEQILRLSQQNDVAMTALDDRLADLQEGRHDDCR